MKRLKTICILILGLLIISGCTRIINPPDQSNEPNISECRMLNCHGLEITCGFMAGPQACDAMYSVGDNCRQFASCKDINGQCIVQKTADFDTCKACAEKCEHDNKDDPTRLFDCEGRCTEAKTVDNQPINTVNLTSGNCGIKNCHGLDVVCGYIDTRLACNAMYGAGDNCRQFVSCKEVNGQCVTETSSRFDVCKTCVERCEKENKDDPPRFFECESKCAEV
jgi:hypothetical protein